MQLMLFRGLKSQQDDPCSRSKFREHPKGFRRKRRTPIEEHQPMLFDNYESLWQELSDMPLVRDLSVQIGTSAVVVGLMRCSEAMRLLELSRSWTRNEIVIQQILDARRGQSIGTVADKCGLNKKYLLQIARRIGLRYRNRRPTRQEISQAMLLVLNGGESFRKASADSGISRSALHRYVAAKRDKIARAGEDGGLHVKQVKQWSCPVHGRISVYPCVACAAAKAKKAKH